MKDHKDLLMKNIGDIGNFKGTQYVVVKRDHRYCTGCIFYQHNRCVYPYGVPCEIIGKKRIMYVPVETVVEEL